MMKLLEVVAAILIHDDKVLCMQRGAGKYDYVSYKYEFPGGKVEKGESRREALVRELKEEMEITINVLDEDYFMSISHEYPDFALNMHCYKCQVNDPEFTMKEHIHFEWMKKEDLKRLDWAPADLPIVEKLAKGD
jgi:8-oxo-dGTP diphosphatase